MHLTYSVKMGYNEIMFFRLISIILRLCLVTSIWVFIWRYLEPKTQRMRILRAAVLLICLLGVLAMLRTVGR